MQNYTSKLLKQRIIFRRIIQIMVIVAIFVAALTRINQENDLFWQLKMGEDIFKYHFFPIHDLYNLSNPGAVWTLEEWLPSVLFYIIYTKFGALGLIILKATTVSATFALFMLLFNKLKVNLYLSMVVILLAAMVNSRGIWAVFPSIFEYLLIALTLFVLEYYLRKKKRWVPYLLAAISLLWVQCHGSFFLFSGIIGAYLFGDIASSFLSKRFHSYHPLGQMLDRKQRKSLAIVFVLSLFFSFIHPNGYWMFLYPFRITFGSFTSYVSEYAKFWQVWNWNWTDFVHGFTFILMMVLGSVFIFAIKKIHIRDVMLAGAFTLLALTAVRHVAIFALVALLLISKYLTVWFGEYRGIFKRTLIKDIMVIILIFCFIYFYKTRIAPFGFVLSEDGYPKAAAELINSSGITGNMFNHYNYGGYLIWKMPNYKVFIDGRLEMYEGQAGTDYQIILGAQDGYKELLDKYKINFFLVYLTDPIVMNMVNDPDWKYIYHDDQYVVFVKNSPQNQTFLAKYWSKDNSLAFDTAYEAARAKFLADYYNDLGLDSLKKNNLLDAISNFQTSINLEPDFIVGHMNLARAYIEFGTYTEAEKEYKYILSIDSENVQAKKNLDQIEKILQGGTTYRAQIW